MSLDWSALGQVTVVSIGATVAVVVIFTLGVLALSRREDSTDTGGGTAALAARERASSSAPPPCCTGCI